MEQIKPQRSTNANCNKHMSLQSILQPRRLEEQYLICHSNQHQKIRVKDLQTIQHRTNNMSPLTPSTINIHGTQQTRSQQNIQQTSKDGFKGPCGGWGSTCYLLCLDFFVLEYRNRDRQSRKQVFRDEHHSKYYHRIYARHCVRVHTTCLVRQHPAE
jgi:hypothetical protein